MHDPLISLIIPTKNALPHLRNAINSIRQQKYRNFELIIQDGGSTDGTLGYLEQIKDLPRIEIVSEPDSGISQAYNRGITRSNGDYLCLITSCECLFEYSLEMAVSWIKKTPSAASINAGMIVINKQGRELGRVIPEPFDLMKFMKCELFPLTTGVFNRKIIGDDLVYDESIKTYPEYEFWLRLGSRFQRHQLINRREIFMRTFENRLSKNYRPSVFERFYREKSFILDRYMAGLGKNVVLEVLKKEAKTGIFLWAANAAFCLERSSPYAIKLCEEAAKIDADSPKLQQVMNQWRVDSGAINKTTEMTLENSLIVTNAMNLNRFTTARDWGSKLSFRNDIYEPDSSAILREKAKKNSEKLTEVSALKGLFRVFFSNKWFHPASKDQQENLINIIGGPEPWGYAAQVKLHQAFSPSPASYYSIKIQAKVLSGSIGICFMNGDKIKEERFIFDSQGKVTICVPVDHFTGFSVIIRNGGKPKSVVEINELSFIQSSCLCSNM